MTTKLAPKAFRSQMMSMWFLADAAGQAINSQIVNITHQQLKFHTSLQSGGKYYLWNYSSLLRKEDSHVDGRRGLISSERVCNRKIEDVNR